MFTNLAWMKCWVDFRIFIFRVTAVDNQVYSDFSNKQGDWNKLPWVMIW